MGYMQDVDRWLDTVLAGLSAERLPEAKRLIRAKLLESYHNGQASAAAPAATPPRPATPPQGRNQKPPRRNGR